MAIGGQRRHRNITAAVRALRVAAAVAFALLLASACSGASPAAGTADPSDLQRPRAENVRLARRIAELEVAVADARRARRTPMDQPVVSSWISRASGDDEPVVFDLCIEYFAHGDFLDLLPNALVVDCRPLAPPTDASPADALRALVTSDDFTCWSRAATDRPLPACWR